MDGKPVEDLNGTDYLVHIGSSETVPGFEEQVIGMEAGQKKEFDLTFPEDFFKPELAGQVIHFDIHLKDIRELQLPDLDDEFVKGQGEFKDLEELKAAIRENMSRMKASDSEKALRRNLSQRLVDDNIFEIPPSLADKELRRIVQEYGDNMIQSGLDNDKVRESILENEEHLKKTAAETIRLLYIIARIGEKEDIEASEEEISDVVTGMATRMGKKIEDLIEEYSKDGTLSEIGFNVVREKVFTLLLKKANITEVGAEAKKPAKAKKEKKGKGKSKDK
jgi:trigger factor